MSYTIRLRIENGTSDTLTVVEKTCWYYANGCTWTEKDGEHVLFMGGSGTSGMLRFKTSSGDFFTVALGMHNNNAWSGLLVNLQEDDTALKLHPEYYNGGKFSSLAPDAAYTPPTAHSKNVWITFARKDIYEVTNNAWMACSSRSISLPGRARLTPERRIEASGQVDSLTKYTVSFSRGSRMCVGMNLAYIELFMTIAYMVRPFDMVLHDTAFEDIRIMIDYGLGLSKHDFKFRGDPAANKELVCSISRLLNVHGIPNLLWGDLVFNLYGVPLQVSDFSFVIPDDLIDKARNILEEAKFPLCHLGQTCPAIQPNRPAPTQNAHFNIKQKGDPRKWFRVELHRKSDLLWTAPEIRACTPETDDPHCMLANDTRLPAYSPRELLGRMHPTDYPAKILTPTQYAEALAMLYYRDGVPGPTIRGEYWLDLQSELVQTGLVKLDELAPRIKRHYELVAKADMKEVHRYSEEVAGQMREEFEIPVRLLPIDTDAFDPVAGVEEFL
ncbi:hypothetical protein CNMCM6805_005382 [Aspergillus fumigatiaffinis]|uniref:Cytochrome P450 n=1 Tax=Aspergillus fumigatiaffinis TaxID=340414 RepID=A0A8H4HBW1_9EURO|nr:hypothetical protein CNMCM6805_005382 [Aspergillus fumigatiaffinis]